MVMSGWTKCVRSVLLVHNLAGVTGGKAEEEEQQQEEVEEEEEEEEEGLGLLWRGC